jgi:hypothetical protein
VFRQHLPGLSPYFARSLLRYDAQPMSEDSHLILPPGCLAAFTDDTGHEALVPDHPVYGLGGCAVMGRDIDRVIRQPWRKVRRAVTGSPDTPLHASEFSQTARRRDIEVVAEFFQQQPFARFGAIISVNTKLAQELGPVRTIAKTLQNRLVDIARWTTFKGLKVIFEASDRADPLIEEAFQDFKIEEDGNSIPVECYFMRKSAGEPALEVADFIMHAVGRQARQNLKQRGVFVPDFKAVFHSVDRKLASFIEVDTLARNAET